MSSPTFDRVRQADQILFAWSWRSLVGEEGMGPVAASLGIAELQRWHEDLRHRVSLSHVGGQTTSLSLHDLGSQAVLLRRTIARDHPERSNSTLAHALVGLPPSFDPRQAIELAGWSGWITAYPPTLPALAPIALDDLATAPGARALTDAAAARVADLVAAVLRHPEARLSVIGLDCPPEPVLWALLQIVETVLPAVQSDAERWTFSTLEGDEQPDLPRLAFLDRRPATSGAAYGRRRVFLDQQPERDRAQLMAERLVAELVRGGPEAVEAQVGGALRSAQVERWLAQRVSADHGVVPSIDQVLRLVAQDKGRRLRSYLASADGAERAAAAIAAMPAEGLDRLLRGASYFDDALGDRLQRHRLRRYAEAAGGGGVPASDEPLLTLLRWRSAPERVGWVDEEIERWLRETQISAGERVAALPTLLALRGDAEPGRGPDALLAGVPAGLLLRTVAGRVDDQVAALLVHQIQVAAATDGRGRDEARELLAADPRYWQALLAVANGDPRPADRVYALVDALYGPDLQAPAAAEQAQEACAGAEDALLVAAFLTCAHRSRAAELERTLWAPYVYERLRREHVDAELIDWMRTARPDAGLVVPQDQRRPRFPSALPTIDTSTSELSGLDDWPEEPRRMLPLVLWILAALTALVVVGFAVRELVWPPPGPEPSPPAAVSTHESGTIPPARDLPRPSDAG